MCINLLKNIKHLIKFVSVGLMSLFVLLFAILTYENLSFHLPRSLLFFVYYLLSTCIGGTVSICILKNKQSIFKQIKKDQNLLPKVPKKYKNYFHAIALNTIFVFFLISLTVIAIQKQIIISFVPVLLSIFLMLINIFLSGRLYMLISIHFKKM